MKAQTLKFKKPILTLLVLVSLNMACYFAFDNFFEQSGDATEEVADSETSDYKQGVKILNWSYGMINFFRHADKK